MAQGEFTGTERFKVRRKLGAGGMGVVYHAWDNEREIDVALKVLLRLDAEGILKLKAEFRALADTSHPNLIQLYELHSHDDLWFFTMELLDGIDFLTWVRTTSHREAKDVLAETEGDLNVNAPTVAGQVPPLAPATTGPDTPADVTAPTVDLCIATDATVDTTDVSAATLEQLPNATTAPVAIEVATGAGDPGPVPVVRTGARIDEERLRTAVRQLAEGVAAVHVAGKLHRDIKPSNALVTGEGRVVMLDFGLASDHRQGGKKRFRDSRTDNVISGTPAYMAPEQAAGKTATAASDWYAVGVMLYEALTGRLPFSGTWIDMLQQKQLRAAVPAHLLNPDAPGDLCTLADALLKTQAAQRPDADTVLRSLGARAAGRSEAAPVDFAEPPFMGRAEPLRQLQDAARQLVRVGKPVVAHVRGPAGIGKSALVDQFADQQRAAGAMVVQGRCYEREAVPYKAFDAAIDVITRWLDKRNALELREVLPRDVAGLAVLFPVLRRVKAVADAPALAGLDQRALRRKAFTALRDLLHKMAATQPLVLAIDDLQWGDGDSVELLAALLEAPDAPAVLWLLSYRDAELNATPVLAALRALAGPTATGVHVVEVPVAPLLPDESRALALQLSGRSDATALLRAEVIAKEAQGSPLFVVELVRYRNTAMQHRQSDVTNPELTLDAVLGSRIQVLPEAARRLLEVVSLAGRPIAQKRAAAAAELGGVREQAALQRLRADHFARTTGTTEADLIEAFHNRIRELVVAQLEPDVARALHLRLANAYLTAATAAADARLDVDALALHFLAAGEREPALKWSLEAARRARSAYANHDALRHFGNALDLLVDRPPEERAAVAEEAAEVARQAGAYTRAILLGESCLPFAREPQHEAEIHVVIGRAYQERGETSAAIMHLETALRLYGKTPPRSLAVLGVQVVGQLLLHLLHTAVPSLAGEPRPDARLQKLADTTFALIRIYYFVDVAKVVWAGLTAMNLARRLRRDSDVALAYSFYGVLLFGMGLMGASAKWCDQAVAVARRSGDLAAEAIAVLRQGTLAVFANDLQRADRQLHEALGKFKEVGEMWEAQTCHMMIAVSKFLASDFAAAEPVYEEMGQIGVKLNATMHRGWALGWAPMCRYLLGRQDGPTTRAQLDKAIELSAQVGDVANTSAALMHCANVAVREGQVETAAGLAIRSYECISKYLVQVPFLQCALLDAAEAALFALENQATTVKRQTLARIAEKGWRKARRMGKAYPYLLGPSLRIEARWRAWRQGSAAAAPVFVKALEVLEKSPNRWETGVCYLDAARCLPHRREELAKRARRIFEDIGAVAELRRMDRELGAAQATTGRFSVPASLTRTCTG
jgi:serine/threonine protein kinase/predicted ATPase